MTLDRRNFLRGAAVTLGGAAVAGLGTASSEASSTQAPATSAAGGAIPFFGAHQAGILTERQNSAAFVAFDLTVSTRAELADLFRVVTARAHALTAGGRPPYLGISAPAADSGILGPVVPSDRLTVTVSVGASVFDDRFGLAARKPRRLRVMDTFPNDNLDRAQCDGDLLLQLCADHPDTVLHALRDIARHTRGAMQPRWRIDGFASPPRPSGTPRNLLGFKDGIVHPPLRDADKLIWTGAGEPTWARGGSYHVVRVIRMLTEFWDRVSVEEQERMIGRRRDSGAPLSGTRETDIPNFSNDAAGQTTPLNAHIRLANPRTSATADSQILRRGYNYDRGIDTNGNLDMGLVFTCFQQDLDRQFVAVQQRLNDEPLIDYISPVGGGYFFALPGVRDAADWYARNLVTT